MDESSSDGDCMYLVLDYCEAENLAEKITHKTKTAGQFSEKEVQNDCKIENI